jgi:Ca2+-binding RTX toxin-like protein
MATMQFYRPLTSMGVANPVSYNSSQFVYSDGYVENYYLGNNLTYGSNRVTGGTLSSFYQYSGSTLEVSITNANASAVAVYNDLVSGTNAFLNYFLAGDDYITGSSYNDTIAGLAGNDVINAGAGNDTIDAGTGNDILVFSSGQDYFSGGNGLDTVRVNGQKASYAVSKYDSNVWTIVSSNLNDVTAAIATERVSFLNHEIIALDVSAGQNAGLAYRMYQAAFNRTPDTNGLAGWINFLDTGGAVLTMADQFIKSQEFQNTYGALDNTRFVQLLYNNVLHRNGEAAGVSGWVGGLNNGMARAQVLSGFSESSENISNVAPKISGGISYTEWWLL